MARGVLQHVDGPTSRFAHDRRGFVTLLRGVCRHHLHAETGFALGNRGILDKIRKESSIEAR